MASFFQIVIPMHARIADNPVGCRENRFDFGAAREIDPLLGRPRTQTGVAGRILGTGRKVVRVVVLCCKIGKAFYP